MAFPAPPLPKRFPCWCRATYSWGGETKRDLGFIEGDLIECLNAGDGSWWTGRLRRDKRMIGLFPSNFVDVLDESFRPTSPLPQRSSGSGSRPRAASPNPEPPQAKSKFRKPFQAYSSAGSPNPDAARRESLRNGGGSNLSTPTGSLKSHKPYSAMKRSSNEHSSNGSVEKLSRSPLVTQFPLVPSRQNSNLASFRAISPAPPRPQSRVQCPDTYDQYFSHSRAASPLPSAYADHGFHSRVPSPAPPRPHSRAPSPNPYEQYSSHSRAASPLPSAFADLGFHSHAPSPAPPRPHSRAPSPNPYEQYSSHSRGASPLPAAFADPDFHSRAPSPAPFPRVGGNSSPPPPAPPPHRIAYHSRAPSPLSLQEDGYPQHSSMPPSPGRSRCTPSPLTQAMNGVMDSLQDMTQGPRTTQPQEPLEEPLGIWSPEAFDQIYAASAKKSRPTTSNGFGAKHQDSGYGSVDDMKEDDSGPPQLGNYVKRMESRLRQMHQLEDSQRTAMGPPPPRKNSSYEPVCQPQSSMPHTEDSIQSRPQSRLLRTRKSAYELGRAALNRTFTHKSSSTNATNSTQHSLMSGASAGVFSATSAGSLARRKFGFGRDDDESGGLRRSRPMSAMSWGKSSSTVSFGLTSGISYHSSHDSQQGAASAAGFNGGAGLLGGFSEPSLRKRGFLKKLVDSAKTGTATVRSTISSGEGGARFIRPQSRARAQSALGKTSMLPNGVTGFAGGTAVERPDTPGDASREMGLVGGMDWVQVRRDVNRSNTISRSERQERFERAQMMDLPALAPIEILETNTEGDEGLDGLSVPDPTEFDNSVNLGLVDRNARYVANPPVGITVAALAQSHVCRPYRSDVQRLRAIFTWVSERIGLEEEFEADCGQQVDAQRVVESKRGSAREISYLVAEMCEAVGLGVEVVRGYLKTPGDELAETMENAHFMRPNHWWNAVIVDGEWRVMDAALASPSNPRRSRHSSCPGQYADGWYFLMRPMQAAYTHVPEMDECQHIVPPVDKAVLLALPAACAPYFRHGLRLVDYDTSQLFLENLEMVQVLIESPEDVECVAEMEVREFARDADGDLFESGDLIKRPALCQPEWYGGVKKWVIKAVLPGDEGRGVLRIYGGKRGLMHSIKSNPHPLAVALPVTHTGTNPPYGFLTRHPTPHAQRHDLYVAQPQCYRLTMNNTYVFTIRQHPSSTSGTPVMATGGFNIPRPPSAIGASILRPTSAMSITSMSASGSAYSHPSTVSTTSSNSSSGLPGSQKPAKLAIQSPSGKIMRVTRKSEPITGSGREVEGDGTAWETVIKVGEQGTWRGLVLADRSARWCVFGEWECF